MYKTISIYQTLNEREKYILEKLEIKEEDLKPESIEDVLCVMIRMTKRISELPITNEQVISALRNYEKSYDIFFKDVKIILTEADYPNVKVNVFRTLTDENKKIIEMLDVKLEDKEITSKEYAESLNILVNKLLIKFGTGIKQKECYKLIDKIAEYLY
ncbi:hypothetical protein [uncultured Clostridium sp.]|jgi:hypothetical protein|uniref:hypothetical protein n=1 Tax=uncultured Clostridium sp. TaxID=59620 RepID=UPI00272CBE57|nr:hypothetical protein [uncultured Clostridium sp.]